jgi:hypothetical protein
MSGPLRFDRKPNTNALWLVSRRSGIAVSLMCVVGMGIISESVEPEVTILYQRHSGAR